MFFFDCLTLHQVVFAEKESSHGGFQVPLDTAYLRDHSHEPGFFAAIQILTFIGSTLLQPGTSPSACQPIIDS